MGGTTSTSGWAVFLFTLGFTLTGTFFLGSPLTGILGLALLAVSVVLFNKAKALEVAQ